MMRVNHSFFSLLIVAVSISLLLPSCNSSSSSSATISGKVIDAEVVGATVTLFSDADMTVQIGSGTTDSDGEFTNITLTVATVPDPIYGYSKGGTLIDSGMPAPTMYFAGSKDATTGEIYITPLTHHMVEKMNAGSTLEEAQDSIATSLGIESGEVVADPTADTETATAVNKALASGTQGVSPGPGTYTVDLLLLAAEDLDSTSVDRQFASLTELQARIVSFEVTVTSGKLIESDGTLSLDLDWDGSNEIFEIVGATNGNFAFMQIEEEDDEAAGAYNWKFSLEFGLMGSFFGSCWRSQFDGGITDVYGLCVGSFTPSGTTSTQLDAAKTSLASILAGDAYLLFRDVVIPEDPMVFNDPSIGSGNITLAADSTTGFDYSNLDINDVDYNGGFNGVAETVIFTDQTGDMDYLGSTRIMAFSEDVSASNRIFFAMAAGTPKGFYCETDPSDSDKVQKIGLVAITPSDSLATILEPGESYNMRSAFSSTLFQGMERTAGIAQIAPSGAGLVTGPSLNVDGLSIGSAYSPGGSQEIVAITGPCVAIKQDTDGDFADSPESADFDSMVFVEMFESGAMAGHRLETGTVNLPGSPNVPLRSKPLTAQAISSVKQGDEVLEFKGTLDLLYHKFDGGLSGQGDNIEDTIIYLTGTLTLDTEAGTASLEIIKVDGVGYEAGNGETITLQVERVAADTNLLHIYSGDATEDAFAFEDFDAGDEIEPGVGSVLIDFWWPIGGRKGVGIVSVDENEDGTFVINEVGECFLNR